MLVVAHRGASGTLPENTLASFKKALELGATAIELDVHRCKTGEMVVIHDEDVNRTTNGNGRVANMTLDELKKLDAGNGEQIPTLEEVLELVDGKATIFIEIKNTGEKETAKIIHQAVAQNRYRYDQLPVISFDHPLLSTLKRTHPDIFVGASFDKTFKTKSTQAMLSIAQEIGAFAVNPAHILVTPEFVQAAHQSGLQVNTWTVNEHEDIRRVIKAGVDAAMGDYPDRIRRLQQLEHGNGHAHHP